MISKLINVLQGVGLRHRPEDVADMLWLARYLDKPDLSIENDSSLGQKQTKKSRFKTPDQPSIKDDSKALPKAKLYPHTTETKEQIKTSTGMETTPFKAPAGYALPGKLAISRSFRPLMKKVASRKHMIFDEHATVHTIAESDSWIPVLKPKRSQWLDVVMIVDESPSMIIWYETIHELKELLERQGAFRNVQLWGFITNEKEKSICLHKGLCFQQAPQKKRDPKELIDPTNRRLILIISDCVSPSWHDGTVSNFLKTWNTSCRVSIVQMLPHYLWERTSLKNAENVYFQNTSSNAVNSKLEIEPSPFGEQEPVSSSLKLPVITLEGRSIFPWAKSLTGVANVWIPGVLLQLYPNETCEDNCYEKKLSISKMPAQDQLKYFMATSSPEAQDLLKCLAALPLTLPVIRLAQKVILPNTRQVHLAEILLSGLIKQNKLETSYSLHSELLFDFEDGIRELLISSQPVNETVNTLSVYIERHIGTSQSLRALIANPNDFSQSSTNNLSPFAQILTRILRLLGGKYTGLAERIELVSTQSKPQLIKKRRKYWLRSKAQELSDKVIDEWFDKEDRWWRAAQYIDKVDEWFEKENLWWRPKQYIEHDYSDNNDGTVNDYSTGLMWQKNGSDDSIVFTQTHDYISSLNQSKFGGYSDWRLPTLEELISLLEKKKSNNDLYFNNGLFIDPVFNEIHYRCWSADNRSTGGAFNVNFNKGYVNWNNLPDNNYVRAVRSFPDNDG